MLPPSPRLPPDDLLPLSPPLLRPELDEPDELDDPEELLPLERDELPESLWTRAGREEPSREPLLRPESPRFTVPLLLPPLLRRPESPRLVLLPLPLLLSRG
jgi:hypothetical protein